MRKPFVAAAFGLVIGIASASQAQTDVASIFKFWPKEQHVQARAGAVLLDQGHSKGTDHDLRLSMYSTSGRYRLTDTFELNPTVGYNFQFMDLHTDDPVLPNQLTDVSVGFGTPLAQFGQWFVAASGAVGYAGNTPFSDNNASYLMGTAVVGRRLGEESTLIFGLEYNGNRTIYPDFPVPGFLYSYRLLPTVSAAVGFPYNSVFWQATEALSFDASITIPGIYDANAVYKLARTWMVFANLHNAQRPFFIADMPGDRRLFFEEQRMELGLKWRPHKAAELLIAGGYAFGQEFNVGFDSRELDKVRHISDEPYLRLGIEVQY